MTLSQIPLIVCCDEKDSAETATIPSFSSPKTELVLNGTNCGDNFHLVSLIHEIRRKPTDLIAHIQRIYVCYQTQSADALFAAVIDFLLVLNRQGHIIGHKMASGAASRLTSAQCDTLKSAFINSAQDMSLLPGNRFSVLTKGLIGSSLLIEKISDSETLTHDPLQLALDAIEYSQLNEAMTILENAIREHPERLPLHQTLLELYRSTHERIRFETLALELQTISGALPEDWGELKKYFEGQSD